MIRLFFLDHNKIKETECSDQLKSESNRELPKFAINIQLENQNPSSISVFKESPLICFGGDWCELGEILDNGPVVAE